MLHLLLHYLGLDSASGPAYLAWSGFASDLSEVTLLGGLLAVYRKHNCHVKRCPRIARHKVDGTPFAVCWRHSPHDAPTHADVIAAHRDTHQGGSDVRED